MADQLLELLKTAASACWDWFNSIYNAAGLYNVLISVIVLAIIFRLIIAPILGFRLDVSSHNSDVDAYNRYSQNQRVKDLWESNNRSTVLNRKYRNYSDNQRIRSEYRRRNK